VPADALPHLFERFYRGEARDAGPRPDERTHPESAGLGLAIVREIVARHGGQVGAGAGSPRGLVVWVELDPLT
jgi:signal transduction histidine kinase